MTDLTSTAGLTSAASAVQGGFDRRQALASLAAGMCALGFRNAYAAADAGDGSSFAALLDELHRALERGSAKDRGTYNGIVADGAARLARLNKGKLTPAERIVHATVRAGLDAESALAKHHPFGKPGGSASPYIIHPRSGAFLKVTSALGKQDSAQRLPALARQVDEETALVQADAAQGVIPPAYLLNRSLDVLRAAHAKAAADPAAAVVAEALGRQIAAFEALGPQAPAEPGVWQLKNGDAYYARALQLSAGSKIDPREAHRWGQSLVRKLHAEADAILKAQGLTSGSVAERLRTMAKDERYLYPATDAGKDRAVADMNARLATAQSRLGAAFRGYSSARLSAQRIPPADEAAGRSGGRVDPSFDGSKPGAYFVDLRNIRQRPSWTLPSVVHHELVPGHLLQSPIGDQASAHAMQLRYAGSYSEGWAIYAEQLADELGWFEGDPLARLGTIQWLLFRVGRLVADTGIHAMRWSRGQAIRELYEIQGDSIAFITIEEDVERICATPGAAAGQMLITRTIGRLRDTAKSRLGIRFDLAGFHDAVLKYGPFSIAGLSQAVNAWVEAQKQNQKP